MGRRFVFAAVGLVYGLALTFWGALISGGGHFNLPVVLFTSPVFFGLLFWPLWGFMSAGFDSRAAKAVFLCTAAAHYAGIVFYVLDSGDGDLYWFRVGMNDPGFVSLPASAVALYLAGQSFLWVRFLRDSFGRRNRFA